MVYERYDIAKWILMNGGVWDSYAYGCADHHGCVEILKWFRENGYDASDSDNSTDSKDAANSKGLEESKYSNNSDDTDIYLGDPDTFSNNSDDTDIYSGDPDTFSDG